MLHIAIPANLCERQTRRDDGRKEKGSSLELHLAVVGGGDGMMSDG